VKKYTVFWFSDNITYQAQLIGRRQNDQLLVNYVYHHPFKKGLEEFLLEIRIKQNQKSVFQSNEL